jgi:hypothetical protein
MPDNKKSKDIKNNFAEENKTKQTELDKKEKTQNQKTRKPMRFQFGPDTREEDIENFLDLILGPDPKKKFEENHQENDSQS